MRFRTPLPLAIAVTICALSIPYMVPTSAEEPTDAELFQQILDEIEVVAEAEGIDLDDVEIPPQPEDEVNEELGDQINAALAEAGLNVRVLSAETFTATNDPELMGRTIFFSDQTDRVDARFVPGDPRRAGWSGDPNGWDDITSIIDDTQLPTLLPISKADTTAALTRATDTWNAIGPTIIPINQDGVFGPNTQGFDVGVTQSVRGYGGLPLIAADILHGGFLPKGFFDSIRPGGGNSILAVTFRYYFIESFTSPVPTDIDNNGLLDAAFFEIYYNDNFPWAIDAPLAPPFDLQTTATHEVGHALSLHHFGTVFGTLSNGKLHFAPRAIMNAGYVNLLHEPTGRDVGLFNQFWAQWP